MALRSRSRLPSNDPFGRLLLQTLAMVAEFEANLNHLRTREGMAIAKRKVGRSTIHRVIHRAPAANAAEHAPDQGVEEHRNGGQR